MNRYIKAARKSDRKEPISGNQQNDILTTAIQKMHWSKITSALPIRHSYLTPRVGRDWEPGGIFANRYNMPELQGKFVRKMDNLSRGGNAQLMTDDNLYQKL